MQTRGFTLLELLISLSIFTIILSLGIPSFSAQIQNTKVKTSTQSLLESVELARSQAVMSNRRTTLKPTGTWENGWEVFIDSNNNGVRDQDEPLLQAREKITGVRITPNSPLSRYVSFIGSGESRLVGGGFQAGALTVCPEYTGPGYKLTLARSGRMRMNDIAAEECENQG